MPLLDVTDLSIGFHMPGRDIQVVNKVSFALEPAETMAIVGESGSGKTQTAFSLIGLLAQNGYATGSVKFKVTKSDGTQLEVLVNREPDGRKPSSSWSRRRTGAVSCRRQSSRSSLRFLRQLVG